jgi:eukaryotic-like serine/threonine-protein kinase
LIHGRFRVEKYIGDGGMGIVYAAHHLALDQPVAIKILNAEMSVRVDTGARFLREARTAAKLKSEHVCRVIDVGELDNGEKFLVMERLDGEDLAAMLARVGPMPVATAVHYIHQVCSALTEAHSIGIIHRDIKPANLFLTKRPDGTDCIKVLDFGIAGIIDASDGRLTSTHALMGSPAYMAPEQLRGSREIDAQVDIWGIGVTLYELIAGARPFRSEGTTALSIEIATEPYHPLPPGTESIASVIDRCLQKKPADRFVSVQALMATLASDRRSTSESVPSPSVPSPSPNVMVAKSEAESTSEVNKPKRVTRKWLVLGIVGLTAVVAANAPDRDSRCIQAAAASMAQ